MLGVSVTTHPRDIADAEHGIDDEGASAGQIYDLHHDAVRAFARRLVGDAAAAEDLVHDVFVAAPAAMVRRRGEGTLRTFLLAIAVNLAKKHVRSAARRRAAFARVAHEPIEPPSTPEDDVQRRELAEALHRALDALPMDQRVAFVLIELEERACLEAAEIAGAPEATMRTRLFHAKRRLRELLRKRGVA
jgi:RNA polymerase sigma-70 factor (ECF subfamily)